MTLAKKPLVPMREAGVASGANSALRELAGLLGVAVLVTVFASHGGYATPRTLVHGFARGALGRRRALGPTAAVAPEGG
jgi:hypothetical protein